MAKTRKAVKKPAAKKAKKVAKAARRPAKKPTKKSAMKVTRKITPSRGEATRSGNALEGLYVKADPALQGRLRALANGMAKPLNEVLTQALTEFADNWEDHMRTVKALGSEDDRMQLAVKPEGPIS